MTLKTYLSAMVLTTALAASAWGFVVYYINPFKAGATGLFLFYITLFFVLVGIFTIVGFSLRKRFLNNELLFVLIGLSFRQAVWLSLIAVGILVMQSVRILNWWDAGLLVVSVFLLEAYFLAD